MSKSNAKRLQSGFARFPDRATRDHFVQATLAHEPELHERAFLSESQPTIVFERLSEVQRDRIRSAMSGLGEWFDDVQFQSMT